MLGFGFSQFHLLSARSLSDGAGSERLIWKEADPAHESGFNVELYTHAAS